MTAAVTRPPVVVLLGGPSAEHDVSVVSGTAIADALREAGLEVRQVLIDLDGAWWWLPAEHRRDDRPPATYDDPVALDADGPVAVGAALDRLAAARPAPVVVIGLHGPFGEDGTIQAMLEAAGLAYTGSGVTASALGMDKALFKRLCRGIGLPVTDWREIRATRWSADPDGVRRELEAFAAGADDPRLMIKPSSLGSSLGMTLVHDARARSPPHWISRSASMGSRSRRPTWRAPATWRSASSATTTAASRSTARARSSAATSSTTTRPSTRPGCPRPRPGPRSPMPSGRSSTS